ncbi:hypothetical protein WICPIJ_007030 [Wickerhamomyces pijperi]|uniref:Uncharacterized protein n=1 Tax=Wickerhamomyces pijperi TaxID=599730 RepID=A0A9P8Q0M6_WICPI|nr:hypothetical protein WICPIJ_007030 [Wickerhamomyces pijperi]
MAPLRASLQLIPSRIEDFKSKYCYFSHDIGSIELRYRALLDDLEYLNEESRELQNEIVCKKWDQIFGYLNCETAGMIGLIEKELASDSDSAADSTTDLELIRSTALTVQNTFDLLHIAIDEDLVDIKVMERSNELALVWLELRNKIPHSYLENAPQQDSEDDSLELIQNLKQLSLEKPATATATATTAQEMSKKEKRRSRAGEFFMGKLNIIPVLIADDSDSSKKPTPRNSLNPSKDSIFNRSPELIQEGFQTKQKRNSAVPLLIEQFAREELQLMETAIAETRTPIGSEKIIKIKDIAKEEADVFVSPNWDNSVKPRELPAYKVPDSPGPIRIQRSAPAPAPAAAVKLDTSLHESRPSRIPRPISKAASMRLEFRPKSSSSSSSTSSSASLKKSSPSTTLNDIITSTTKFIPRPTSSLEAHFHSLSGVNPSSRFTALSSSNSYKYVDDETF